MTSSSPRAAHAALAFALSVGAAVPALVLAPPAAAQQAVPAARYPAWVERTLGAYAAPGGTAWTAVAMSEHHRIHVRLRRDGADWAGELQLAPDLLVLEGALMKTSGSGGLVVRVRPNADGSRFTMDVLDSAPGAPAGKPAVVLPFEPVRDARYRQAQADTEAAYSQWIGDWVVQGRRLEIRSDGPLLVGTLYGTTGGGRVYPDMRIIFRAGARGIGTLLGTWERGTLGGGAYTGGALAVEMAENALGFVGDIVDRDTTSPWRGTRVAAPTRDEGWTPEVRAGGIEPRPGYVSRAAWCRVRIVDSQVKLMPGEAPGTFQPRSLLTVAVHNASADRQTLAPTTGTARGSSVSIIATAGAHRAGGDIGLNTGGFPLQVPTLGAPYPAAYGKPVELPAGSEVQLVYLLAGPRLPPDLDTLTLVFHRDGDREPRLVSMPDAARWLCPVYEREQALKASGDLGYAVGDLPALCAGGAGTPADPRGAAEPPSNAGTPAPPVPPSPAPGPTPGTAPAHGFHSLEQFDVRLDEARAGRDGRLHLFLTTRNRSGRDFHMSSGPFRIIASDADGVGVEAETRPLRATGEEPTAFEQVPTISAGSEFRMRYVIDLPVVHAPLRRVSVRESAKKAVYFDVGHADPDPSPAPAPATGRGAFKPLSRFDLRIDNVVPARDGRLEVFVTLRNSTREVQPISKGEIQLSATNADGGKVTSASSLHSVRAERGRGNELPLLLYAEPGAEMRLRFMFEEAITGPISASDGRATQVYTSGGS